MLYALLVAALVALDQLVKYFVRENVPLYTSQVLIPRVLELTHVQNTGAAFSLFSEHTWILAAISAVVSVGLAVALFKRTLRHPFAMVCLSLILAGAVGNLIDRLLLGYVTDMFNFLFVHFAVFNVADACLVIGCIASCIYLLFFYGKYETSRLSQAGRDANADADG